MKYLLNNELNIDKINSDKHLIDWNVFTYYYSDYITYHCLTIYKNYINYNILYDNLNDNMIKNLFVDICYIDNELNRNFIIKFEKFIDEIIIYNCIDVTIIELYKDKVDWLIISRYGKLSEYFIEKFKDKVYWRSICLKQKLSETFIEKFKDKVYWDTISMCQKLSEYFIEKFKDKVDWDNIIKYQNVSEEFINKFKKNN